MYQFELKIWHWITVATKLVDVNSVCYMYVQIHNINFLSFVLNRNCKKLYF